MKRSKMNFNAYGKPSIAILGTKGIPARYGGFETFAEQIAIRLAGRGIDVTVYCEASETSENGPIDGVKLVHLPAGRLGPFSTILFDIRCLWHARKKYDIVYMLGYGAAPFCCIPRIFGTTVWLNVDGIEWARAKWSRIAKTYFKLMEACSTWAPDRLIADAEGIRLHLESRHRRLPACSVIPYGATIVDERSEAGFLEEWGLEQGGYYLVVCRLEPENHVLEIIQGFLASDSARQLVVVGNYDTGTNYTKDLISYACGRVKFIGSVYENNKIQALRGFSYAYFHGHSVGGTNPSLLEAMGCGNLIIAHDNVFNREVAGEAAFYFAKSVDVPPIIELLESAPQWQREVRANAARSIIRDRYDWERIASSYEELVKEVCLST